MLDVKFSPNDQASTLTQEQLEFLAKADPSLFIYRLRENPGIFDAEALRLLLALGKGAAKSALEAPYNKPLGLSAYHVTVPGAYEWHDAEGDRHLGFLLPDKRGRLHGTFVRADGASRAVSLQYGADDFCDGQFFGPLPTLR